jgi:hypothetical protein
MRATMVLCLRSCFLGALDSDAVFTLARCRFHNPSDFAPQVQAALREFEPFAAIWTIVRARPSSMAVTKRGELEKNVTMRQKRHRCVCTSFSVL